MKKLIVPVLNNNECKEKYKDDPTFGKAIQQITEKQIFFKHFLTWRVSKVLLLEKNYQNTQFVIVLNKSFFRAGSSLQKRNGISAAFS